MEKMDGDSTKSESSGEGSKSSVTSPGGGGNGPPSKRSRYGAGANSPGYLDSGGSFPNYMWGCLTFSSDIFSCSAIHLNSMTDIFICLLFTSNFRKFVKNLDFKMRELFSGRLMPLTYRIWKTLKGGGEYSVLNKQPLLMNRLRRGNIDDVNELSCIILYNNQGCSDFH